MAAAHDLTVMFRAGAALGAVVEDLQASLARFYRLAGATPDESPEIGAVTEDLRGALLVWRMSLRICSMDPEQIDPAFVPEGLDDAQREQLIMDTVRAALGRALEAWSELHCVRRDFYTHPLYPRLEALAVSDEARYVLLDYYRATERDMMLGHAFGEIAQAHGALEHVRSLEM